MKARFIFFIVTWLAVLVLGHGIAKNRRNDESAGTDLIAQILGDSRTVVSSRLFKTADRYYHGGLQRADCAHLMEHAEDEHGHEHGHEHGEEGGAASSEEHGDHGQLEVGGEEMGVPLYHGPAWYRKLFLAVRPSGHVHLTTRREVAELLPWFRIATKVDPHNVQAYEVGAFWLARQLGDPPKGLEFLAEGIRKNPDAFELELTRGQILLAEKRFAEADAALRQAEQKWLAARKLFDAGKLPAHLCSPDDILMAEIMVFRAEAMKRAGNVSQALALFRRALPYSRDQASLRARISELENAVQDSALENGPPQEEIH